MYGALRQPFGIAAVIGVILSCASLTRASATGFINDLSESVQVKFAKGDTELAALEPGVQLFTNYNLTLKSLPEEIPEVTFTRRSWRLPSDVTIDAPAGATVYVLLGTGNVAAGARRAVAKAGWTQIADAEVDDNGNPAALAVYKRTFTEASHFKIPGRGYSGDIVAANQLVLTGAGSAENPPKTSDDSPPEPAPEAVEVGLDGTGPTTQISKLQSSIEGLYVLEQPSGGMLGGAARVILTASPGVTRKSGTVPVTFATPVGHQMKIVLDEVVRAIDVHYGLSGVKKIELSFEDKYDAHDGGSIGAAIGTLMLSMIRGFDIDPNLAITGDVSADAKVLRIGGVAAKLRGAAGAGCTLAAVPADNFDQVQDAMTYEGPSIVTNVQVIGVSDLDEAAAVARADRAPDLAHAIDLFGEIRDSIKASPDYLYTPEATDKLHHVLALAPKDYSAKVLLLAAQHKVPRLSAAASKYYTFVAVDEFWDTSAPKQNISSYATDEALGKLARLRPIADMAVRPYIDAWMDDIRAWDEWRRGSASVKYVNDKYQAVMNEAEKLDANRDLSEKMLREGI